MDCSMDMGNKKVKSLNGYKKCVLVSGNHEHNEVVPIESDEKWGFVFAQKM